MVKRGSPSLVGRGIANPMFARTRGFESHSPRLKQEIIYNDSQVIIFIYLPGNYGIIIFNHLTQGKGIKFELGKLYFNFYC